MNNLSLISFDTYIKNC